MTSSSDTVLPLSAPEQRAPSLLRRFAGAVSVTFLTSLGIQACNTLAGILGARVLGPEGKGLLTAIIAWPVLLALLISFTSGSSVTFHTAQMPGRERELFASAILASLTLVALIVVPGWWLIGLVLQHDGSVIVSLGRLYLVGILFAPLAGVGMAILQAKALFGWYNLLRFSTAAGPLTGTVLLIAFHALTVGSMVAMNLLVGLCVTLAILTLVMQRRWLSLKADRTITVAIIRYGLKAHLGSISSMVNQRGDQLLMTIFVPAVQLGFYAMASSLTAGIGLLGTTLFSVTLPLISGTSDRAGQRKLIAAASKMTLYVSLGLATVFFFLAPWLITLLLGPAYLPSLPLARWLALAAVVLNLNVVLIAVLQGTGYPLQASIAEGIASCLTLLVLFATLPTIGVIGGVIASVMAYSGSCLVLIQTCRKKLGIQWWELLVPTMADVERVRALTRSVIGRLH